MKESIERIITNTIITDLLASRSIISIQKNLNNRSIEFYNSLKKEGIIFYKVMLNVDNIDNKIVKWKVLYIKECYHQINILNWVVRNKSKFPKLEDYKLYNLYKFGDKFRKKNNSQ